MSKSVVGIYRLYKLGKMEGNKFDKSIKKLQADLHPVHHEYADQVNENSEKNGMSYELDETATDKYWNGEPYREGEAKAPKAAKDPKQSKQLTVAKAKKDDPEGKDPDLDLTGDAKKEKMAELRSEYLEITKEEAIPTWGVKKLKEQILLEKAKLK